MAEKVTVRGGGSIDGAEFTNAATEATLLRLLDALKGKKDGTSGQEAKLKELANKALKENTGLINDSSSSYTDANKNLGGMSSAAKNATSSISKLGEIGSTLASGVFSAAVSAGTLLTKFFTDSLDAFRETSSVGATFNNDLILLRKTAAEAAMPLDEFTSMIKNNSSLLAALGGTVTQGSSDFAKMSKDLRTSDFGQKMMGMGMTMGDLNDYLASYLDMQLRSGKSLNKIKEEEAAGTRLYIEELDKVTKITGMSRKQAEAVAMKASIDPVISALRKGLNPEELAKSTANLALATKVGGQEMEDAMKSMAAGKPDALGKMMLQAGFSMEDAERAIKGGMDPKELMQRLRVMSTTAKQMGLSGQGLYNLVNPMFASLQKATDGIDYYNEANSEAAEAEQARRNKITEALGSFQQIWQKFVGDLTMKLISSKVFEKITNGLTSLADKFLKYAPKIGDLFVNLIGDLDNAFETDDLMTGISNAFGKLFDKITPIISNMFSSLFNSLFKNLSGGDKVQRKADLETRKKNLIEKGNLSDNGLNLPDQQELKDIQNQLDNIDSSPLDNIKKSINGIFPIMEPLEKVVKGLAFAFENWGWILGGLVVGGGALALLSPALSGVGAGLMGVLGPIGLVAAAIGIGAGGLGYMFNGVSEIIKSFVDGFKSVPVVIEDLMKLDSNKMKDVGIALTALSDPMIKLAGGGILATLGGSSGLGSIAESLQKFTSINPDSITSLIKPLRDFKETLTLYTGSGILDSFATGIGNFFKGDSGLGKLAEGFKAFNGIDPSGLDQLSRIDTSKLSQLGASLEPFAAGLKKLGSDNSIKTLFSPNGIVKLSEALVSFGSLNANNVDAVVTSIGNMKTIVGSDFSNQAAGVNTFTDSIKNLNKAITDLNASLATISTAGRGMLGGGPSNLEVVTTALGGANTGSSVATEKLNTLVTELVSLTKEIKDSSKDQVDALRGRREAL